MSGLPFSTNHETDNSNDAVQLFNDRALRVYPDFELDVEQDQIVRICRLVEGMPLALELAAAWRKTLNCQEIADEILGGLAFLTTRLRNATERHQSIQTVFDQTWQRLKKQEQDAFMRLSVFRGGFLRDAAAMVTGASLTELSALVDKSLLHLDKDGRYQIHELLRQYAAEKLSQLADEVQQVQADHASFYFQFLHQRSGDVGGGRQREALGEIRADLDNIRAAWLWAVMQGEADAFQKGSESLGIYYQFLGGYQEGMTLFSQATVALQAQPTDEVVDRALLGTRMYEGWYHLRFGQLEGTEACMADALAIYRRLDTPPLAGYLTDPRAPLSFVALTRGDYATAIQLAEQIRDIAEIHHHATNRQFAYHLLSEAYVGLGAYETAQNYAQQAYAQSLMKGDRWFRAYILNNMGQIAVAMGDNIMAKTHFQASYEIRRDFDDPEGMALALVNLGNLALKEKALTEAGEAFLRSCTIYQDINDQGGLAAAHWGLGMVAFEQDDLAGAHVHLLEALQLAVAIDYRSVLFGLIVSIAELLWKMGQQERPLTLLAFTIHHPKTDHETRQKAQTLLTSVYQPMVTSALMATAFASGESSTMVEVTTDLFGQLVVSPLQPMASTTMALESARPEPNQSLSEPLTPRELDVLILLCAGLTNAEIADELNVAVGTIKFHTGQIYGKLGVRNRVMAVARARQLDLVSTE